MLFQVQMDVTIPPGFDQEKFKRLKAAERERALELQRQGKWRHLWRIAGRYANISIFEVADASELNDILFGLPLFPFMQVTVTALCPHPSALPDGGARQ